MSEPDLGWRVWHLNSSRLESWAVDYQWVPGENVARCLANSRLACASSPGRNCHCGFWAVSAPGLILNRVGGSCEPPWHVMGLISAEDRGPFHGPAERWIETLASLYTDYQMNAFVFWPSGDRERQSRIWAEEVVPAAREALRDPAGA